MTAWLVHLQRIYEENEEDKAEEGGEAEQDKEKDKPEDKKVLMVNRVKEALERGFDVLDNAYEIVQEEVVESPAGGWGHVLVGGVMC